MKSTKLEYQLGTPLTQWWRHKFEGGGVNALKGRGGGGGGQYSKNHKILKRWSA